MLNCGGGGKNRERVREERMELRVFPKSLNSKKSPLFLFISSVFIIVLFLFLLFYF